MGKKARGLPSLDLIRGFEVVACHMSITRAAAESFVTPPAVSGQIKALEEQLDIVRFRRMNRALLLTYVAVTMESSLHRFAAR